MKILFISQFLPYFPNTGGKIKTWEILKILAKKHQVYLACFVDKKEDLVYEKEVRKRCSMVKTFIQPIITQAHQNLKSLAFLSLFSLKPFRAYKHYSPEMAEYLREISRKKRFDVIYFDHDVMLQYLEVISLKPKTKIVYDEHNISSLAAWRNFRIESNWLRKLAYLLETVKWFFYERKYLFSLDQIFTISEVDRKKLTKRGLTPEKISFLPTPMKLKPKFKFKQKKKNILFIGLMSWKPNEDGFWWFYNQVFPEIKQVFPEIDLVVVGAFPSEQIKKAAEADKSLRVLGYVKNLLPFFEKASVFIVPVRSGGGIRIKILTALARGIPVVSTSVGAEGIVVRDAKDVLIADEPKKFAKAVLAVLKKRKLAESQSAEGISFIKKNYSVTKAANVLEKVT